MMLFYVSNLFKALVLMSIRYRETVFRDDSQSELRWKQSIPIGFEAIFFLLEYRS